MGMTYRSDLLKQAKEHLLELDADRDVTIQVIRFLEGAETDAAPDVNPEVAVAKSVRHKRWNTTVEINENVVREWLMADVLYSSDLAKLISDYTGVSKESARTYRNVYIDYLLKTGRIATRSGGWYAKVEQKAADSLGSLVED